MASIRKANQVKETLPYSAVQETSVSIVQVNIPLFTDHVPV